MPSKKKTYEVVGVQPIVLNNGERKYHGDVFDAQPKDVAHFLDNGAVKATQKSAD